MIFVLKKCVYGCHRFRFIFVVNKRCIWSASKLCRLTEQCLLCADRFKVEKCTFNSFLNDEKEYPVYCHSSIVVHSFHLSEVHTFRLSHIDIYSISSLFCTCWTKKNGRVCSAIFLLRITNEHETHISNKTHDRIRRISNNYFDELLSSKCTQSRQNKKPSHAKIRTHDNGKKNIIKPTLFEF